MTADIRTAAQQEAGARVIAVTRVRQTKDSTVVEGTHYRVARAEPTLAQIERAIMGRTATAGARAVLALIQELAGGITVEDGSANAKNHIEH